MKTILLLIDDDVDEHEIFTTALRQVNPDLICMAVTSGSEALEQLRRANSFTPDLIFLDLNMPKMDGVECLTELKKVERLQTVPVIMYSTSDNDEHITETKELGASGYIVKPGDYLDLVQALSEVVTVPDWNGCSHFYFDKRRRMS